jgi:hypothetical protein
MEKWEIIDDIEEIQEQVDDMGFVGSNEKELWTRDMIADYIFKKLTLTDVVASKRINLVVFEDYTRCYKVSDKELKELINNNDIEGGDIVCKVEEIKKY